MKAKAYIVHRAMCEPVLEWSRPKNCLFFEPLYASTQAQPAQQEPVAYMDVCEKGQMSDLRFWSEPDNRHQVPLYTSPPASKPWVGLTEEEIDALDRQCYGFHQPVAWRGPFARAIEAKLKEKNT